MSYIHDMYIIAFAMKPKWVLRPPAAPQVVSGPARTEQALRRCPRGGGGAHLGAALRIDELVVDEQLSRQGERSDLDGHLDAVVKVGGREV